MHIEVDQSGKIGNGQQDVVLVCTLDWVCLCGKEIACSQIGIGYFSWGTASRPEGDRGDDTRQILDKKVNGAAQRREPHGSERPVKDSCPHAPVHHLSLYHVCITRCQGPFCKK